ncbi:unnamed protein product [Mycena citricolor]|uniref:RTA1-domain-containing protein n=1 Tax=Mycena citricolor TaxID=2018698 RepID=A0AAD2GWI0_9AGAR|nr:unnamed protein product [Mycena citricolor]
MKMQRALNDSSGNSHLLLLRDVFGTWSVPSKTTSWLYGTVVCIKVNRRRRNNILNHSKLLTGLPMSRLAFFLTLIVSFASVFAAEIAERGTADPSSVHALGYVPSRHFATMGIIAFAQSVVVSLIHFIWVRPIKLSLLTYVVGMTGMLRTRDRVQPPLLTTVKRSPLVSSSGPWTGPRLSICGSTSPGIWCLILLSPSFFIATCYFLLAHLGNTFKPDVVSRCLFVSPSGIMTFFVGSNLVSFLLEGGGGALTVSQHDSLAAAGSKIVLTGFILQAATLLLFIYLLTSFTIRMSNDYPHLWKPTKGAPWKIMSAGPIDTWRLLVYMIFIVCGGLLVRTVYRVVEFAGGYNGTVANKELYFYLFEALPLAMTTSMFISLWPTRFLHRQRHRYSLPSRPSEEALKLQPVTAV